ncbi:MAG: carboxymuconolactone decarboxylase family protein [Phycisphaerales bacterium]|nr:carboxymuconolactone decarboxylase family protein [Phycisphaerales bacterium]
MPRISPLTIETASPEASQTLEAIKGKIGMVPNIYATLAHAPAALTALLGFGEAVGQSSLSPALREQIALTIAGVNSCDYCASAHTMIGKGAGVNEDELASNLAGNASDSKTQAFLTLAKRIVEKQGHLSDAEVAEARDAGITDQEIIEVLAVVAQNIFTNYFNHIADPEIDFPVVRTGQAVS